MEVLSGDKINKMSLSFSVPLAHFCVVGDVTGVV